MTETIHETLPVFIRQDAWVGSDGNVRKVIACRRLLESIGYIPPAEAKEQYGAAIERLPLAA